jgi:hypothetical protein
MMLYCVSLTVDRYKHCRTLGILIKIINVFTIIVIIIIFIVTHVCTLLIDDDGLHMRYKLTTVR